MNIKHKPRSAVILVLAAALVAATLAGCGGSSSNDSSVGNQTDAAFIADMVPHHEGAIDMAQVARERAEHGEIRKLAEDIISGQQAEISVMDRIGEDLHHMGIAGGHMGMSAKDMGVDGDMPMLKSAKPFDLAFIDMMIPHHRGAIRMAMAQLSKGEQPALRRIAKDIIAAQTREIAQMRAWRKEWYGRARTGGATTPMDHGDAMMDGQER